MIRKSTAREMQYLGYPFVLTDGEGRIIAGTKVSHFGPSPE